jgi:hypothetical protein
MDLVEFGDYKNSALGSYDPFIAFQLLSKVKLALQQQILPQSSYSQHVRGTT